MRFIDRFTRDDVSAKIWWPLALVGIVALVLTVPAANHFAEETRADAAVRAAAVSRSSIEPLTKRGAQEPELTAALSSILADDPVWSAVRVWSAGHARLATTAKSELTGSADTLSGADLDAALADGTFRSVTDRSPSGDAEPTTFHAYTKIDGVNGPVVAEFEARDATLLAEVHRDWLGYRIVAGLATLLFLTLAFLSMREPIARIGVNVPFYPESIPTHQAVIDVDRAVSLEQAGGRAHDRVTGLQQRLEESERLRLTAEADLQQALTALSSTRRNAPVPRTDRSAAPPAPSGPVTPAPARTAPPAAVTPARQPAPAAPAPVVTPAPAPVKAAKAPPPAITTPAPAAKAPPAPPRRREAGKHVPADAVTVASDELSVTAAPATHGPDSDDDVLDVLHRLVPEAETPRALDDPGDLRARLARTAALKKPGSRERQEQEASHEGPPQR